MKLEELVAWMRESGHYLVNVRCSECSTIFMEMKDDKFKLYAHNFCPTNIMEAELEIEDERYLGGAIGDLVTVKEVKENATKLAASDSTSNVSDNSISSSSEVA